MGSHATSGTHSCRIPRFSFQHWGSLSNTPFSTRWNVSKLHFGGSNFHPFETVGMHRWCQRHSIVGNCEMEQPKAKVCHVYIPCHSTLIHTKWMHDVLPKFISHWTIKTKMPGFKENTSVLQKKHGFQMSSTICQGTRQSTTPDCWSQLGSNLARASVSCTDCYLPHYTPED